MNRISGLVIKYQIQYLAEHLIEYPARYPVSGLWKISGRFNNRSIRPKKDITKQKKFKLASF